MGVKSICEVIAENLPFLCGMVSALIFCLINAGCGNTSHGGEHHEARNGYVSFQTNWQAPPEYYRRQRFATKNLNICTDYGVSEIHATIINDAGATLKNGKWGCATGKAELLGVVSGAGRILIVKGYLANTTEPNWHYRSEPFTVQPGQTTDLGSISMQYQGLETSSSGPEVVEIYPTQQDSPVPWDAVVRVRFGAPVVGRTLNAANCRLEGVNADNSLSIVSYDIGMEASASGVGAIELTMTPIAELQANTEYKVTIEKDIEDLSGKTMAQQKICYFKTAVGWKKVSAAGSYAIGIRQDGTLWSWGYNIRGQLGIEDIIQTHAPKQIIFSTNSPNWIDISSSGKIESGFDSLNVATGHTLALNSDGVLWGWGNNDYGQAGGGAWPFKPTPSIISTDQHWQRVASGANYSVAINDKHDIYTWGNNENGQLGREGSSDTIPAPLAEEIRSNWQEIASGDRHTLALRAYPEISEDSGCAVGCSLWSWGANNHGQLGLGSKSEESSLPQRVETARKWIFIAAQGDTSYAIDTERKLFIWGRNNKGQYGEGISGERYKPERDVGGLTGWLFVAPGYSHVLAVRETSSGHHQVYSWGQNDYGQLGRDGTEFIRRINEFDQHNNSWQFISAGDDTSLVIDSRGVLYSFGRNDFGQAGIGDVGAGNTRKPNRVDDGKWIELSADYHHTMAISEDKKLFAWGLNAEGQLGDGSYTSKQFPVQIGDKSWVGVDTGFKHTVAIDSQGRLYTWGDNEFGQIGDNEVEEGRNVPGRVKFDGKSKLFEGGDNWGEIAAGYAVSFAVNKTDNTLWGWGVNAGYQVASIDPDHCPAEVYFSGRCDFIRNPEKIEIPAFSEDDYPKIRALAAGDHFGVALYESAPAVMWGPFYPAFVGPFSTPTNINIDQSWQSVEASDSHMLAINTAGLLVSWGNNEYGQLGLGIEDPIVKDLTIQPGEFLWESIETGSSHSVGILDDGTLWAWGNNALGQLGNGSLEGSLHPVQIDHPEGLRWKKNSRWFLPHNGH
jgi:alpha-tubulin suppressor-like RCC1 family protein